MKTLLMVLFVAICATLLTGCGGGGTPSGLAPLGGTVVTNNPTAIVPFAEVQTWQRGKALRLRLNRQGTEVREFPVWFEGAPADSYGEHLLVCRTAANVIIAQGDSGSPVLTEDGKIVGALCYGFADNDNQFMARSIEDLLAVGETRATRSTYTPIGLSYCMTGINTRMIERLSQLDPSNNFFKNIHVASERTATGRRASGEIIAGQSLGIAEITGDILNGGAIGAISFVQSDKIYAFGHAYNWAGQTTSPAVLAEMGTIIDGFPAAFKLAAITTTELGTLVEDRSNGIVVDRGVSPQAFPVAVTVSVDGGTAATYNHQVANGTSEKWLVATVMMACMDRKFDQVSQGTANGTLVITTDDGDQEFPIDNLGNEWDIIYGVVGFFSDNAPSTPIRGIRLEIDLTDEYTAPPPDDYSANN